jgi:VanZ family protein
VNKMFNHILRYQFPAVLWAIIIYIASSIPAKYLPSQTFFAYDKIVHITLFLIFGLLVYRALEPIKDSGQLNLGRIFFSIAIVISYGVLDEIHQGSVPGRTVDIYDALADTVGGLVAGILIFFQRRKLVKSG